MSRPSAPGPENAPCHSGIPAILGGQTARQSPHGWVYGVSAFEFRLCRRV
ncbi:hypothetical protein [Oceanisphaera arctica]|nr:hypothetical protein [Oceanisphaera arctica]